MSSNKINKEKCFVIMPFTVKEPDGEAYRDPEHWDEVYQGLILPAVSETGMICTREDTDVGQKLITENILRNIEKSDLVLCDISSHNPNVFLELGWALRADKPFILIKDELTEYSFDLNNVYVFTYSSELRPRALNKEVSQLSELILETKRDDIKRYSLVKSLELSMTALLAAEGGDYSTKLLLDIKGQLDQLTKQKTPKLMKTGPFPWPMLIRDGVSLMYTVKELLENEPKEDISSSLLELSRNRGVWRESQMQFSVIDENGDFVYHDWLSGNNAIRAFDYIEGRKEGLFSHPFGCHAWTSRASNTGSGHRRRYTIAVYTTAKEEKYRVIVEMHHTPE